MSVLSQLPCLPWRLWAVIWGWRCIGSSGLEMNPLILGLFFLGALSCATCPSPWPICAYSFPSYFCLPPTLVPFAGIWHLVTAAPPSTPGTAKGTY